MWEKSLSHWLFRRQVVCETLNSDSKWKDFVTFLFLNYALFKLSSQSLNRECTPGTTITRHKWQLAINDNWSLNLKTTTCCQWKDAAVRFRKNALTIYQLYKLLDRLFFNLSNTVEISSTSLMIDKLNWKFRMLFGTPVHKQKVLQKVYLSWFLDIFYLAVEPNCT